MNSLSLIDTVITTRFSPPPSRSVSRSNSPTSSAPTTPVQTIPPPLPESFTPTRGREERKRLRRRSGPRKAKEDKVVQEVGWFGGAFVAVLALWADLWTILFGASGSGAGRKSEKGIRSGGDEKAEDLSSGSETEDGDWVDPVTRAPEGSLEDQLIGVADAPPSRVRRSSARQKRDNDRTRQDPPGNFSFHLRSSAAVSEGVSFEDAVNNRINNSTGSTSILTNPSPISMLPPPPLLTPTKLLPNPLATSLLSYRPIIPAPRSPRPSIPRLTPFHLQKTLILDLDETLIHSTSRPHSIQSSGMGGGGGLLGISLAGLGGGRTARGGGGGRGEGHTIEVVLGGRSTLYHVYKRPFVDHFLKKAASWYTLVIFTASMQEYADPVIDWLDGGRGLFAKRLYRDSCSLQLSGSYIKDLALVDPDLSKICFMDNSPISYNWNKANALPIEGWTSDPNDEALLDLLPVLDSLRFTSDVRRVLGIRGFG